MKFNIVILSLFLVICFVSARCPAQLPDKPKLVLVKGGAFNMGSDASEAYGDEKPVHKVTVSSFNISKYEITCGQFRDFCIATGRPVVGATYSGKDEHHPVINVTYYDCEAYCTWLSETFGGTWRLPTEAEWEYAARGGNKSKGYTYSGGNNLQRVGWYEDNAGWQTSVVGRKKPNELGIYDMSGNVWEWCRDWYLDNYYAGSPQDNPAGPASGTRRVLRGGSWDSSPVNCRVSIRFSYDPAQFYTGIGFRVVKEAE